MHKPLLIALVFLFNNCFTIPLTIDENETKKIKQEIRNRVIWGIQQTKEEPKTLSCQIESIILKSNYAQRFAFLPDSSPFKQACSKIHDSTQINDACAVLSNFLYCMQHPYNPERPVECQEFCKEYFLENPVFKKTVLALQKELHLDPKEVIDFMRALTREAEANKSPELCSASWASNLKTKLGEFKNSWWKSEEDEDDSNRFC